MNESPRREILITDLYLHAVEKENISTAVTRDKWRALPYECAEHSGTMLVAGAQSTPRSVNITLGASGKYRIYLGMAQLRGATTTASLRLSDSEEISAISPVTRFDWTPLETVCESYYKTAELDGKTLVLSKPGDYLPHTSTLAWIRLVPTENEPEKEKCIAYHLDSDYFADEHYTTPESVTGRIGDLADGGAELILQETFAESKGKDYYADPELYPRAAAFTHFHHNKSEVETALINKAHAIGAKIYAAYRPEAAQFAPPNDASGINVFFEDGFEGLEDKRCVSRDGRVLAMCSFAYPEVRRLTVERIIKIMKAGYDGISLIFVRGTFVAFEKPICDEVMRRYGIDARRLPMSDPRYAEVASEALTDFLRELRCALRSEFTEHKAVNPVVFFTPEDSRRFGFDIARWIDEGLVDGISQGLMRVYEDLDGTLDADGLVDLEKYKSELLRRSVIKREFRFNAASEERIIDGAREYMRLCDGKVDFYATLLWEAQTEEETCRVADELRSIGVTKFISWNANHKAKMLSRINAEKHYAAGSPEEYAEKRTRYIRTLSVGGADVSQFDPNWKG